MDFKNKVCLITGGTSGIGRALVMECLKQDAMVVTCGRKEDKLKELKEEAKNENLYTFKTDVAIEAECKALIDFTIKKCGKIDVLVNNAGMSMRAMFKDMKNTEVVRKLMDVNFRGTLYCTFYALSELLKSKGVVVGVSSIAGYRGLPGRTGYSASKFAMQGFLETLRTENLYSGLHVMWVCPGFTSSNIRKTALDDEGKAQKETPLDEQNLMSAEEVARRILQGIKKRKRTMVMTSQGKLTVLINKLFPSLADKLVYNHFKKEPNSPLK